MYVYVRVYKYKKYLLGWFPRSFCTLRWQRWDYGGGLLPCAHWLHQPSIRNLWVINWSITLEFWVWGWFGSVIKVRHSLPSQKYGVSLSDWSFRSRNLDKGGVELPWRPYWIILTVVCGNLQDFVLTNLCVVQNYGLFQMISVVFTIHFINLHKLRDGRRWTTEETTGWES